MDLTALQIFTAVVEQGGINKAAARLHRVPSNVTTRIKQLEEQLGAKLFAREGRRLTLSAEGKVLLAYAEQLLRLSAEARAALRGGKPRGVLRIGALESTAAARLPPVSREVPPALSGGRHRAGHRHFRVAREPRSRAGSRSRFRRRAVQRAPASNPSSRSWRRSFSSRRRAIRGSARPRDIGNLTVIAFANGCSYRRRLEAWLGTAKVHPDRVMEFQSYHAILACVAAGSGIAVVPRSVIGMTSAAKDVNIVALPAATAKAATRLVWRPSHHSVALEALRKLLKAQGELARRARRRSLRSAGRSSSP